MATPHIQSKETEISKNVIMPGDPLRAKFIAETYLTDVKQVNKIRNCFAYTGKYKGLEVTIFASGMGIPSMGIYAYELFKFYNVERIIRVGSCGSYKKDLNLFDLILVSSSISNSSFAKEFSNSLIEEEHSSEKLNQNIISSATTNNKHLTIGNIYCSEAFYHTDNILSPLISKYNCLGVEMETFSLFHIAKMLNKEASAILTVSDSLVTEEQTTSEQREKGFTNMIEVALDALLF